MKDALSIDFEDCLCNEFLLDYIPKDYNRKLIEDQVIEATNNLLKLLNKYDVKVTFFVLGKVAEKYPDYVKLLYENGHEIGSHSYSHTPLYKLGKEKFESELINSTNLIKSITHEQPLGFRAPNFSINQSTSWAFELLYKNGYKYDSSIFPIKTMLYGVPDAPLTLYKPNLNDITKNDPEGKIIEFPMTVLNIFKNVPVSGGFYLRVLPQGFLDMAIGHINKKRPAIVYIHPWETYVDTPKLKAPIFRRFEAYHGIKSSLTKLERLLKKYQFTRVRDVLNL